jgi:predicted AlkP superfamily phosphohydrolase/phosphomutase
MHLVTIRPTQPAVVWTSVATGKYPAKTGIRAAAAYAYGADREPIELLPDLCFAHALVHLGILREVPNRSTSLRARPLWAILGSQRLTSGVVSWPVTSPAAPFRGFLVTEQFVRSVESGRKLPDTELGSPEPAVLRARAIVRGPLGVPAGTLERPPSAPDAWTREIALQLRDEFRPRFLALRHEGIDRAGHLYLRYARPREFGGVSDEERRRFGSVLDRHYAFLDGEIAELLATLGPEDLLLVVSGFGLEPANLGKRILARLMRQPDVSGSHENAPDGFLLAYGASVRAGRVRLGELVDVAPTILYFLGLPIARDMDGAARTDIFTASFTASRLITFIPTYER